jgi:uncharacterized membrane protein
MPSLSSARRRDSEQNIGPVQRGASLLAGSTLVAVGLRRRGVGGAVVALAGADLLYRGATGYCHLLGALEIDTNRRPTAPRWVEIQRSITIQRPRIEVYREWREPQNQPLVWSHFAEVTTATSEGARWRVDAPLGRSLEWETRIVEDRAAELIRWESTGGDLPNEGTVEFRDAPGEYGTEITLWVRFDPPFGPLGDAAARLFDDGPKLVLAKALRRFKSLAEAGEVASIERNPSARNR